MRLFIPLLTLLALCSGHTIAQESKTNAPTRIPASQARDHIGADAVVFGKVAEVNIAERLIRINFDKPFPKQTFTAVIFSSKTNLFPEVQKLKDKPVEVSGKIETYRERPQIVITKTNQLSLAKSSETEERK